MNLTRAYKRICLSMLTACLAAPSAIAAEAVIKVKHKISMEDLARAVTDTASPRYHVFYTPAEIKALAAPTDDEYANLVQELQSQGLEVTKESSTHLWLSVKGDQATIERLDGRARQAFTSLDFSPTRMIDTVQGLAQSQKRRPMMVRQDANAPSFSGYQPADVRKFYGFDQIYAQGINGQGQHIAIATYDDFNLDDVNQYYQKNNIVPGPQVDKVNFNGTATLNDDSAMETQLDAEFSGMVAPAAQIHVFTSADNSDAGEEAMFTAILDDNRAQVVNYSWGSCDQGVDPNHRAAMQTIFARAVAQGVNIMIASGDSGSSCDGSGNTVTGFQPSLPYVVAVGGTTLPSGLKGSETGWSDSGGGISTTYASPSWQANLGSPFTMRSYPDVAYNADPNSGQPLWAHANGASGSASYIVVGGTSIAAPQWSGFMALVGQARGGKALGYLNPILYGQSNGTLANVLNDVTSGNNGAYNAGPGFDAVTGLGTMQAQPLLTLLKNQ